MIRYIPGFLAVLLFLFQPSCSTKAPGPQKMQYVPEDADFAPFVNSLPYYQIPLKKGMGKKHPRLFFTADDIPRLREQAKTTHAWFISDIKRHALHRFKFDIPVDYRDMATRQSEAVFAWGWWRLVAADMLYMVEQDTYYRDVAKKWVMRFVKFNKWRSRETRSDLSDSDFMSGIATTYDILYDEFSPEEKDTIRQALMKNIKPLYDNFL